MYFGILPLVGTPHYLKAILIFGFGVKRAAKSYANDNIERSDPRKIQYYGSST